MKSFKVKLPKTLFHMLGIMIIVLGVFIFGLGIFTHESIVLCCSLLGIIDGIGFVLYFMPKMWDLSVTNDGFTKRIFWIKKTYHFSDIDKINIGVNKTIHIYSNEHKVTCVDRACTNYTKLLHLLTNQAHIKIDDYNNPDINCVFRVQPPKYERISWIVMILPNCFWIAFLFFPIGFILSILIMIFLMDYETQYVEFSGEDIMIKKHFKIKMYESNQLGKFLVEKNIFSPADQNQIYVTVYDVCGKRLFKIKTQDRKFNCFQKKYQNKIKL